MECCILRKAETPLQQKDDMYLIWCAFCSIYYITTFSDTNTTFVTWAENKMYEIINTCYIVNINVYNVSPILDGSSFLFLGIYPAVICMQIIPSNFYKYVVDGISPFVTYFFILQLASEDTTFLSSCSLDHNLNLVI